MADSASKLPEEDQADIPHVASDLQSQESRGGRRRGDHSGSGSPSRSRGDHSGPGGSASKRQRGDHQSSSTDSQDNQDDPEQSLFNDDNNESDLFSGSPEQNSKGRFNFIKRNKVVFITISTFAALSISLSSIFFLGIFNLPNFMKNIEQAGFQRYQIDLEGRSDKWLVAYMQLRFGEVDDPNLAPKDRDNLFFRADQVDTNRPLTDWYRTLRASKFEQTLFEQQGIRFTSIAYKDGNVIKHRAGIISFKGDERITFDPGQATFDAIARGDPNAFNGALNDLANVDQKFETDKAARAEIGAIVKKQHPEWWKAVKRYHLRQDIQNMIGVRSWTFFENTRTKARESTISMRNKVITQALPDSSATGDFIKCLFGLPDCNASSDPANPDNNVPKPTGADKQTGDKTDGNPDNPQKVGDDSAEGTLEEAAKKTGAGAAGDVAGKIVTKLIAKAGIFSMLDSLARFDEAIHNQSFSKIVAKAKGAQVAGAFATFGVVADQLTTGQQDASEVNAFMLQFQHGTNSEAWTKVVAPQNNSNKVSAASSDYVEEKDKSKFCSDKHQAEMKAHPLEADKEFQWLCAQGRVGGDGNAKELEDTWNEGIGVALHPILNVYHQATGGIFDVFNSVVSAITDPVINAALTATGTKDNVEDVVAAGGAKALELGGATPMINDTTPSGSIANSVLQGSSVTAEASMRDQGGIPSNTDTIEQTQKNLMVYQADQENTSFFTRYLSPSNPKSLFATGLFALGGSGATDFGHSLISIFGNALSSPVRILSQSVHAAPIDGYAACKFTGITCHDMPKECLNPPALSMTPQNSTNADDLGYFKSSELNWDLMTNKDDWYAALYDKVGGDEGKALKVYNCALFDNTTRGGIGARWGAPGENSFKSSGQQGNSVEDTTVISGDAQELAREILNNKNISIGASDYCRYCEEDIRNTAEGKPAYGNVQINLNILKFLAELGSITPININSITGEGSGHSDGSNHYSGNAVDFECGFDEAKADEIAKKYGLMASNERCDSGTNHSHFSKDGY